MTRGSLIILIFLSCPAVSGHYQSKDIQDSTLAAFRFRHAGELYEASKYDSVAIYYSAARDYYRRTGQLEMELRCIIGLADIYRIKVDFDRCENFLEQAEKTAGKNACTGDALLAEILYVRGKLASDRGDYREAAVILERTVEMMDSSGAEIRRRARAINSLGIVYSRMGDLDRAEQSYRKSHEIICKMPDRPLIEEAWYHMNMSAISKVKGDFESAIIHDKLSCLIQKTIYGDRFPDLGDAYYTMAINYFSIGIYDTAEAYIDSAELYYSAFFPDNPLKSANLYMMRGSIEYRQGNQLDAQRYYQRCWNLLSGKLSPSHTIMMYLYASLGNVCSLLHDYKGALYYYNMLAEQSGGLHPSKAFNVNIYLADTYARLGNWDLAEQYYRKQIHGRIRYFGNHNLSLAEDYYLYALFLSDIGELDSCLTYCLKALTIRMDILGPVSHNTADCYRQLGECWNKAGSFDSALYYYQEALHSLCGSYDPTDIYSNPASREVSNQSVYAMTLKGKAETLHLLGEKNQALRREYLATALSCCELIFPVIDDLKNSSMTEEGRLFIADNERKTYDQAVNFALSLYEDTGDRSYLTKAFLIAEKAKYTTLLMAVRNNNALSFSRVPADLLAELQDIKNRVSAYRDLIREEELSDDPGEEKLRLWQEELYTMEDREQQFIRKLEKDYPDYYRLKFNTSVSGPQEIMANLHRNDRLIEYYLTGNALVAFVLAGREMTVNVHPVDSAFLMKMDTMRTFCFSNTLINNRQGQADHFRKVSSELYDILIRPCGVRGGERLIIIPDAGMNYLPFDALLSDSTISSIYYKDYPFLIKSNPIIYTYSATLLMNTRPGSKLKGGELLAMAPAYDAIPMEAASVTRALDISREKLGLLQGTVEEINGIQKITGGMTVSGYDASEYRFKQLAPDCSILHMAMHAYMDDTDPLYSKLVFSDNREGGEDGFLNTYEIYDLELNARMVVLSACQTGAGIVRMGEGIMSLARAFYYSGVPNVVMTLWAVSDTSGRKLMVDFYNWLSFGLDKGKAMQKAKIKYMESAEPLRQQPYYWAGYIVTGDPSPVFRPELKWLTAALLTLLIVATVTLIVRNRRRKAKQSEQPFEF